MNQILIICPVYNEEGNLREFFKKISQVSKNIKKLKIVFVNDGSDDQSLKLIKNFCKKNNGVKYLSFNKNYGHQNAILAGLENFKSDYYIAMDTDLQHDPALLLKMIEKITLNKVDLVQMKKDNSNYESQFKTYISKFFYKIFSKLVNIEIANGSSDFYIINKELRDKVINSKFGNNFLRGLIHWLSIKKLYISYSPKKRLNGKSKYNFSKQSLFALTGIINFFSQFYFMLFKLAAFVAIFSFFYIIYIVYDYSKNGIMVDGWNTLIILILAFGAIQILISSIQVYVLSRIYNFVGNKPNYVISELKK